MAGDVTIRTSLLENRFLDGSRRLPREFRAMFDEQHRRARFYAAKALEQQQRHQKCNDAIYNLEPNVKESPGGLRDLQTVLWISRAAGLGTTWAELARHGLMTIAEARAVSRQERFIGAMRVRLHYLSGPARGSPRVRPASGAGEAARPGRHAGEARQRAADAALLPRREAGAAGQHHPAAEPACAAAPGRDDAGRRSTPNSRRWTNCSTCATRTCSRGVRRRCSTRS